YRHPKRLLFATDLRERDVKPIRKMQKFARDLGVEYRVLHIVENKRVNQDVLEKFNQRISEFGLETELFDSTSFLEGIVEYIDGDKQTIVVTTRYRKSFLEWLISKSTARVVAQITNVPLLLIPKD
ncbi:MAG: universal stress protein, partial [Balneolaceae bacterium]|nr:universal stress protein [Balneolaceae bacterium]